MFVCCDCGRVFDEPRIWIEDDGLDFGPYRRYSGCPSCGGAFTEAHECDCCKEWITGCYVKLNSGERICEECYVQMDLGDED